MEEGDLDEMDEDAEKEKVKYFLSCIVFIIHFISMFISG